MLHKPTAAPKLSALSRSIARSAAARDADGAFPSEAFAELSTLGLLSNPPIQAEKMRSLLMLLAAVGRGDLNVGRIFEGHVNACWLIASYGTERQREIYTEISQGGGGVFGVWNTDAPADPLRLEGRRLVGSKNFASGVDGLSHAIVTVTEEDGRRMIIVPVANLPVDRSWWRPVGMRASGSHIVDFTDVLVEDDWLLGGPDDYIRQPWFVAGAIRFVAVQVGGMHAVFDATVDHLQSIGRAENPYQAHRLARMGVALESGYLWLSRVAEAWQTAAIDTAPDAPKHHLAAAVNGARLAVETAAMDLLEDAERGIGAAGMIAPHPFERLMRDMRTYLRQPNPDGAAAAFGEAIAAGAWVPSATDDLVPE
ncbi:acyl-CoA dehydrogenase family protein [Oryzicola mucosus]|uniref:Acyl-CoA dehydrogenase family protein n=1 Tax=Oryzicola mucosus TaxID=2767425 RepID=A0A8J6U4Y3_9HYPH|nr:acyl-CoA dehydrogenase family protein [Oryzicola mucosus]MBD0415270.1 acyl-CoA dehydrogenase family protein [Oryzicola mucosus]